MQNGLLGAIIVGSCCSLIGVFVVLRGMSYIGAGIAHGCLAGVALAFLMGWNPLLLAITFALIMVILIETINKKAKLNMDTAIGVLFSFALALAVLFIGMIKRYTPDIMSYLFGNLLGISTNELWVMGGISIFVLLIIILFYKEILFSTFDPEMAEVYGIPAGLISLLLTVLMGLTIVISLQAVGELLVLALIVLPASTAYKLTTSIHKMIIISVSLGVFASIAGLIISYYLENIPSGSIIVITLGICFIISLLIRKVKPN
ncbi:MAG TPA: metal ABC transporter permease [Bacillota bacterium]|nr:metal ABC transporter permease [Bacillota bacterium]HOL10774.1 metal ABC transporter permease [Bacillota bacterium]HPO98485.1 metal ABC transporter permease [Bacillota bacterium]